MAELKTVEDISSLTEDVENFFENPNFTPKKQNKFFFSEGTSYYKQLLQVCKIIKMLQTSLKSIYANQTTIQKEIDDLDISSLTGIPARVSELETKAVELTNRIVSLENDNTSNKARITNNETAIDLLKTRVSTNETNINSINTSITSLQNIVNTFENRIGEVEEDVRNYTNDINNKYDSLKTDLETNYLKDVNIDSQDILVNETTRVDGVKTLQLTVSSSTPVDIGNQLNYIKQHNADVVSSSSIETVENEDIKTIDVNQEVTTISNGTATTSTNNIVKLNADNFSIDEEGKISTTVDLSGVETKINEVSNKVDTNTTDIATNKANIETNTNSITELQTNLATTNSNVTNNTTAINDVSNNVSKVESNLATTNANVVDNQNKIKELQEKDTNLETQISEHGTLITNNQSNISNNTNSITQLESTSETLTTSLNSLTDTVKGTLITAGTDLNTITTVGNYYCAVDSNYVNAPEGQENKWCSLEVRQASSEDYVIQIWWSMDRTTHAINESYMRLLQISNSTAFKWTSLFGIQNSGSIGVSEESTSVTTTLSWYDSTKNYTFDIYVFGTTSTPMVESYSIEDSTLTINFDSTLTTDMTVYYEAKEVRV